MKFILHFLLKPPHQHQHRHRYQQSRSIFDSAASIKWVRDRALDHAVEKERNLKPMLNLKNLIKSEPSKSLPLALIVQNKQALEIPIRPIDFIRKYPSVFEEFLPGGVGINPHVKLTPQVLDMDIEEQLVYQSENHKQEVADRLLKLLMIGKINKIPLHIVDKLKWDLGLPQDYAKSIVAEFPDYFQVNKSNDLLFLELVCWSSELAVSVMEKKAMSGGIGYKKGMPIEFPVQYSRGFDVDKKFKKWVDDWQKLPYISPYENVLHSQPKSEDSDKWAVGVLHEVLSLFVPKKTEKDNILYLGEYLGVRSRFKRALLQHPGIFYISSKLHTHTVVLREGYKRDLLIGKHNPVMGMRSKYIHLMNMVKEENKSKSAQGSNTRRKKTSQDSKEGGEEDLENEESIEEKDGNLNHMSDSEFEDESDDEYDDEEDDDDDDDENEDESTMSRERTTRKPKFEEKMRPLRNEHNQSGRRYPSRTPDKESPTFSRGKESPLRNERNQSDRRYPSKSLNKQSTAFSSGKESPLRNERNPSDRRYPSKSLNKQSTTFSREKESPLRNERNQSDRRYPSKILNKESSTFARGKESPLRNERNLSNRRYPIKTLDKESSTFSRGKESPLGNEPNRSGRIYHSKTLDKQSPTFSKGKEGPSKNEPNQSGRRYPSKTMNKDSPTNSRGKEMPARQNVHGRPNGRLNVSRNRETSTPNRRTSPY